MFFFFFFDAIVFTSLFHPDTAYSFLNKRKQKSFQFLQTIHVLPCPRDGLVSFVVDQRARITGSLAEQAGRKERQAPPEATAVCRGLPRDEHFF